MFPFFGEESDPLPRFKSDAAVCKPCGNWSTLMVEPAQRKTVKAQLAKMEHARSDWRDKVFGPLPDHRSYCELYQAGKGRVDMSQLGLDSQIRKRKMSSFISDLVVGYAWPIEFWEAKHSRKHDQKKAFWHEHMGTRTRCVTEKYGKEHADAGEVFALRSRSVSEVEQVAVASNSQTASSARQLDASYKIAVGETNVKAKKRKLGEGEVDTPSLVMVGAKKPR